MSFNLLSVTRPISPGPVNIGAFGDYLASQDSGLIKDKISIGSFVFDYAGEVTSELKSDITDHYTEDNTAIQDHIALNPIRVTMRGLIGELVAGPAQGGLNGLLGGIQDKLTTIPAYIGGKTPQIVSKASKAITQVQKVTTQISSAVSKGKSLLDFMEFGALTSVNQALAYKRLEAMWATRSFFSIRTPYRDYKNMVIESMKATQTEDTKYISEFTVTLKQIRQATVTISKVTPGSTSRLQAASNKINTGEAGTKLQPPFVYPPAATTDGTRLKYVTPAGFPTTSATKTLSEQGWKSGMKFSEFGYKKLQ